MYLKLVGENGLGELDIHVFEGDYFHWGWQEKYPDEYFRPFAIPENRFSRIMVIEVFNNDKLAQTIVLEDGTAYVMSNEGQTIDKLAV